MGSPVDPGSPDSPATTAPPPGVPRQGGPSPEASPPKDPPPEEPPSGHAPDAPPPRGRVPATPPAAPPPWYRRHKKLMIWGAASLVLLLVAVAASGYLALRHFNANLQQADIRGLLGSQPVDTHPQAENIMVIGSDSRQGLGKSYGSGLVTDQSDTLMIIHIPASRQWAEVMSIPRDSWVNVPSCQEGNGQMSEPSQFKINSAFAVGNLDGNHTALGVACTVKTIEKNTGIYIDHFIVVNFTGFQSMVSALGGVYECNPAPINDPNSGLHLSAGTHLLTPKQALGYVRARYTLGDGSDLERIDRQQAFMSSLVSRVQSELLNPLAIYRFLDAATRSLTIDSQLGGVTGLYNLGQSLRGIPSAKIAFFTVPSHPRGDGANVVWNEPEDGKIFASFRDDVPASSSLFGSSPDDGDTPLATPSGPSSGTPAPASSSTPTATSTSTARPAQTPSSPPAATPTGSGSSVKIPARTANQSICAG